MSLKCELKTVCGLNIAKLSVGMDGWHLPQDTADWDIAYIHFKKYCHERRTN